MSEIFGRAMARIPGWNHTGYAKPPVLIELTAKRWKALIVIAFLLGWSGIALVIWQLWLGLYRPLIGDGFKGGSEAYADLLSGAIIGPVGIIGLVLLAGALGIGFYARFMAWWRHG